MRYPEFLSPGGTIGFVAPSFGCVIEPYHTLFHNALERFHKMGYQTVLGPNVYEDRGIGISNTPELCAKELNEAYVSGASDVLISCGGGELMCEAVSHMDFERMAKAKPKWFLGYSDNTNFTFLSTTLMDTAAVYGPCASEFGQDPLHPAMLNALSVMTGEKLSFESYEKWELYQVKDAEHPLASYNLTEPVKIVQTQYEGPFGGRLIGGCMDCLVNLTGTRFDKVREFNERYREDGIIWFMEACDLNTMAVRRALWNMKEAGWFENVKGFLIGRPRLYNQPVMGLDQYEAVTGILKAFGVPILMDIDLGHLPPQIPMLSGAIANVQIKDEKFCISYECR